MKIDGVWYNELNSTMELRTKGKEVTGSYVSTVGKASGPYDLIVLAGSRERVDMN